MKKPFIGLVVACLYAFVPSSSAEDLSSAWRGLYESALEDAKIVTRDTSTTTSGDVVVFVPRFAPKGKDIAKQAYKVCHSAFSEWARENEVETSFSESRPGDGEEPLSNRITVLKAKNGDYASLIYRAPSEGDVCGTLTIIVVDASKFDSLVSSATNRRAEQDEDDQAAALCSQNREEVSSVNPKSRACTQQRLTSL